MLPTREKTAAGCKENSSAEISHTARSKGCESTTSKRPVKSNTGTNTTGVRSAHATLDKRLPVLMRLRQEPFVALNEFIASCLLGKEWNTSEIAIQ